jgi:hypothetical protein
MENNMTSKRIAIATFSGLVMGLICTTLASSAGPLPNPIFWQILSSRTLMGFAIGISSLKLRHWSLHGAVLGMLFSLPIAFSAMLAATQGFSAIEMFTSTFLIGAVYGLVTELITSVVFKART